MHDIFIAAQKNFFWAEEFEIQAEEFETSSAQKFWAEEVTKFFGLDFEFFGSEKKVYIVIALRM